jgi:hypothetical protein
MSILRKDRTRLANTFADAGTGLLNAVKTFGMSAVGDAINGISPKAADFVQKYSGQMIPHTSEQEYIANRPSTQGAWNNRLGSASSAATNVMAGEMIGPAISKGYSAAKGVIKPIYNKALTKGAIAAQKKIGLLIDNAKAVNSPIAKRLGPQRTEAYVDHLYGLSDGIYDLKQGRPFFETFPITPGQKKAIMAKQDVAAKEGTDFVKKWFYDESDRIRPQAEYKLDYAADPVVKILTDNNYSLSHPNNPLVNPKVVLFNNRTKGIKNLSGVTDNIKEGLLNNRSKINARNVGGDSYVQRNKGFYYSSPKDISDVATHEVTHSAQELGYDLPGTAYADRIATTGGGYYIPNKNTPIGREIGEHSLPVRKDANGNDIYTWAASPRETHSDLMVARKNYIEDRLENISASDKKRVEQELIKELHTPSGEDLNAMIDGKNLRRFFKPNTSPIFMHKTLRTMPAVGAAAAIGAAVKKPQPGPLKQQ